MVVPSSYEKMVCVVAGVVGLIISRTVPPAAKSSYSVLGLLTRSMDVVPLNVEVLPDWPTSPLLGQVNPVMPVLRHVARNGIVLPSARAGSMSGTKLVTVVPNPWTEVPLTVTAGAIVSMVCSNCRFQRGAALRMPAIWALLAA